MRPTHRREAARVIDRLLAAPQEFEFVQAVRILLAWLARQGVAPEEALRTHLRFENSLRLGFPAGEIEALSSNASTVAQDGRDRGDEPACLRFALTPAFMGLLGAQGTLPLHITQRIAAWQAEHDDEAPRAFLDMLSGRMLGLFYHAWHKYRIEQAHPGRSMGLQPMLLALTGKTGRADRGGVVSSLDSLFAHFAGLLEQRPVSAVVLERVLGSYFGVGVRIEEAIGHWNVLDAAEQPALGLNAQLGENTLLGARSWRPDLRARLTIGPLGRAGFARFLPGGTAARALHAVLQTLAEPTVGFEVRLILRAEEVVRGKLAGAGDTGACLGRDSFMVSADATTDRADMRYLLMPMAPLPANGTSPGYAAAGRARRHVHATPG